MKAKIEELLGKYHNTQNMIFKEIEKLPNYGTDCICNDAEMFSYVFDQYSPDIITVCLKCGGNIYREWN